MALFSSRKTRFGEIKAIVGAYAEKQPIPTCLRNHAMIEEMKAGKCPVYMQTQASLDTREKEEIGREDFLGMTIGQAVVWASQNIDPRGRPSGLITSEPCVMGSHATCSGAWATTTVPIIRSWMTPDGMFSPYRGTTRCRVNGIRQIVD